MPTQDEYNSLLHQLREVQKQVISLHTALSQMITLGQAQQLSILTQTELNSQRILIDSLAIRVTAIEQEPLP